MAGEPASLMPAGEVKVLLKRARRRPVPCVIAMTKDRQAVVMLHKRTKPRKLALDIKAKAHVAGV